MTRYALNHHERIDSSNFSYLKSQCQTLTDMKLDLIIIDGVPFIQIADFQTNSFTKARRYIGDIARTVVHPNVEEGGVRP